MGKTKTGDPASGKKFEWIGKEGLSGPIEMNTTEAALFEYSGERSLHLHSPER